jgi:hypothetical protein
VTGEAGRPGRTTAFELEPSSPIMQSIPLIPLPMESIKDVESPEVW